MTALEQVYIYKLLSLVLTCTQHVLACYIDLLRPFQSAEAYPAVSVNISISCACVCVLLSESDQLHEDVRSGKDTGPRDDNAPSNGPLQHKQHLVRVQLVTFHYSPHNEGA